MGFFDKIKEGLARTKKNMAVQMNSMFASFTGENEEFFEELEDLLDRLPVDEERTREKLQEIAVAMYETVDPREYETHRMKRLFQKEQPRAELDAKLIAQTISAVMVDSNGRVKIKLKNEQIIERG